MCAVAGADVNPPIQTARVGDAPAAVTYAAVDKLPKSTAFHNDAISNLSI